MVPTTASTGTPAPTTGRRDAPGPRGLRRVLGTAALAVPAATAATTLAGAAARALGVELEVPDDGERVPLGGIAVLTGFFSTVGLVIAVVLHRWSTRPAARFVQVSVALTAASLAPPFLVGASIPTACTLAVLHLVAAAIVVPALARALRPATRRQQ
ncbi:hypothetical protein L615_000200000520 [Nocardioides sp. J9]|uniref:DUF6069 family protein n=1 Tax=Nocardioides sp. J9 TaxID=935844 RepID=UPI0011AD0572|nr:DUF6069 family protein [Nocardioides sp. J9]TWH00842.1 hypothetical protein L615_000200000520 [Nocardioides sp. J9]